ncbi:MULTISPECIES: hypothetical protein [unclassified Brenneria]|uniref:hypothetical protein n=1 Tax=unclassified Brenneria TaxID=2634434 RepID=UPI0029C2AB12|nr:MULTISPECIES: hypothetical protein [unclassified Brenneria]MDX5631071.1 hypothetical protein [Brenneria sp. L3-3Z]MDX5698144.1 hypothetical protein [Brenneria sp. L4-2C]
MLKENEKITFNGSELIEIIKEVNYILISLNKIGGYYYNAPEISNKRVLEYKLETADFIDRNEVCTKLANIRKVLSEKFNDELGTDDMDDIERATEDTIYWEKPGD